MTYELLLQEWLAEATAAEADWRSADAEAARDADFAARAYELARMYLIAGEIERASPPVEALVASPEAVRSAGLAPTAIALMDAILGFDRVANDIGSIRTLARAVDAAERAIPRDDMLIGLGWLEVSAAHLRRGRPLDAYPAALSGRLMIEVLENRPALIETRSAGALAIAAAETGRYDEASRYFFISAEPFSPIPLTSADAPLPEDWVLRATQAAATRAAWRTTGGETPFPYPAHTPQNFGLPGCMPDFRRQREPRPPRGESLNTGAVLVRMGLDANGRPQDVTPLHMAPNRPQQAEAVIDAVESWRTTDVATQGCAGGVIYSFVEISFD